MKTINKQTTNKKLVQTVLALFVTFATTTVSAQTISGNVINEQNEPVEFANVALFSLPDSTLITGTVTNERGEFTLQESGEGRFLQISFLGYETELVSAEQHQTVVLQPAAELLGEVVVTAHRRLFQMDRGDIVAQVRGTILETLVDVNTIIAQMPFVSERNGNFTVFGRGTPVIYINNRLVRNDQELAQLSPSNISSIRVITMPGAAYDSSVRAVIRITTYRPAGEGLSGRLFVRGDQASVFQHSNSVRLNYRVGAWDIFGAAMYARTNRVSGFDATQTMLLPDNEHQQLYESSDSWKGDRGNFILGFNFNPNERHSAGIQYDNMLASLRGEGTNYILHTFGDVSEEITQTLTNRVSPDHFHHINSYYDGRLSDRFSLNINTDIVTGNTETTFNSQIAEAANGIVTNSTRNFNLFGGRGILSYSLQNGVAGLGMEYVYTDMLQTFRINDEAVGIANTNDNLVQNRRALFATYQAQFGSIGLNAGLRYENIVMDYFQNEVKNEEQSRVYNEFLPNVSLSFANQFLQATVGFERRVNHPTYHQLRSNIQYSSPFIFESGNPLLLPHIENQFSVMLASGSLQIMAGYSIHRDAIHQIPTQFEDQPIFLIRNENIARSQTANIGFSLAQNFGMWRPRLEGGMMKQWLTIEEVGKSYNSPIFTGRLINSFSLPRNITLWIDARGNSAGNIGIAYARSSWGIDARVSKTFLSNRLTAQLIATDIFKTSRDSWDMNYGKINMSLDRILDSRSVSLIVVYTFNATQSRFRGQQSSDEINRL
jgi:hypothetical protein